MASSALKARGISSPSIPLRLQSLHLSSQFAPSFQTIRIAAVALPVLGTTFSNVGSWISSIWDTVLKAVPKKKQSYARKRTRQLANKGLKDIPNVVPCSSCGRPKRPHMLCRNCMACMINDLRYLGESELTGHHSNQGNVDGHIQEV